MLNLIGTIGLGCIYLRHAGRHEERYPRDRHEGRHHHQRGFCCAAVRQRAAPRVGRCRLEALTPAAFLVAL